jgi:nicotinate phosphoribosyltransferase
MEMREYCQKEQNTVWEESRRLVNPHEVYVDLSDKLYKMKADLLEELSELEED